MAGENTVRPAVVIGLGGTGQWALTYLKKELMEVNGGTMPENVRLLSFDTMPEGDAGSGQTGLVDVEDEDVFIGNVRLKTNEEFIALSGNSFDLGKEIASGRHPHLGSWFDARHYLDRAMPALWDLASGAGQVRQFGRLGFFMNVDSEIWPRVANAFRAIRAQAAKMDHETEVIIVASFAGGTGAGMFIDMGVICRALAGILNNKLIIRGFLVLPRAFTSASKPGASRNHMMARSFAAWRELDRFMTMGKSFGTRRVTYRPGDADLDIREIDGRPFDTCYIVDSARKTYSLENTDPRYGIYPSIADFISAVLDPVAGWAYTAHVSTNIGGSIDRESAIVPRYGAFGSYTYKVPILYGTMQHALGYSKDFLNQWLVPRQDENQKVIGLSEISNPEKEGMRGSAEALSFMQAPDISIKASGKEDASESELQKVQNTALFPQIAEIYHKQLKNDRSAIDRDAEGGHAELYKGEIEPGSFLSMMVALPIDASDEDLTRDIEGALSTSIWEAAPTSKDRDGDPQYDVDLILDEVKAFRREQFGVAQLGAPTFRGAFGNLLDRARKFQVDRFRLLLNHWTRNTLNGFSTDGSIAKRGKLGFAHEFYGTLQKAADYFIEYLEAVRTRRDEQQIRQVYNETVEAARLSMVESAGARLPLGIGPHPRAFKTQEEYLAAVHDKNISDRDDMLIESLINTAKEVRAVALQAREQTDGWIKVLATGDSVQGVDGLHDMVEQGLKASRAILEFDQQTQVTQNLIPIEDYDASAVSFGEELNRISWDVRSEDGFRIDCSINVPKPRLDDGEETWVDEEVKLSNDLTAESQERNYNAFSLLGVSQFRNLPRDNRVIEMVLQNKEFGNAGSFAEDLIARSEPLFMGEPGAAVSSYFEAMIARLSYKGIGEQVNKYVQEMQDTVQRQKTHKGITSDFVDSPNFHRLTMVHTIENVPVAHFDIWNDLKNAYLDHIQRGQDTENASRLHIFPAEFNAAKYERLLPRLLDKGHRIFHPRIVGLLENVRNAKLFFRCYVLGYIERRQDSQGATYFSLTLPGNEMDLTEKWPDGSPDIFDVMQAFVNEGKDAVNPQKYLDYEEALKVIRQAEKKLRDQGELVDKYNFEIKEGFVAQQLQLGEEQVKRERRESPDNFQEGTGMYWVEGQARIDLADIAHMMFLEILKGVEEVI